MEVPSAEDVVISDGHDSQSFMILIRTVEKRKVGSRDAPTHTQLLPPTASPYQKKGTGHAFSVCMCVWCVSTDIRTCVRAWS